ncbi:MAG: hypothetical protein HKL96_01745 [Phycisphaerales bacterium]|nr:hypothetical protein [Phycisphaerales bacterium]
MTQQFPDKFSEGDAKAAPQTSSSSAGLPGLDAPADVSALPVARQAVVDRLLEHGRHFEKPTIAAGENPADFAAVQQLMAALSQLAEPVAPADLAARTVAAVKAMQRPGTFAGLPPEAEPTAVGGGWRINWMDHKFNIAALLVASAVLVVLVVGKLSAVRFTEQVTACAGNLQSLAGAFAAYAANNNNLLPSVATAADRNWLPPSERPTSVVGGGSISNISNLAPMMGEARYASWNMLAHDATGPASAAVGAGAPPISLVRYSYLDQLSRYHHHYNGSGEIAVLADRNPLFVTSSPDTGEANSPNHAGQGQNVLFDDGSVRWSKSPDVGPRHDNIWTIGSARRVTYTGLEEPGNPDDIILVP